jgi:hypothetical protein
MERRKRLSSSENSSDLSFWTMPRLLRNVHLLHVALVSLEHFILALLWQLERQTRSYMLLPLDKEDN